MTAVGESLTRTRNTFDGAMGKLVSGRGNIVRQLQQMKTMGGRTAKSLPSTLLEAAEGGASIMLTTQVVETEITRETTSEFVATDLSVDGSGEDLTDEDVVAAVNP